MLTVKHLSKTFIKPDGSQQRVLDNVDFTLNAGEFVAVLGHSGCGKTTFLKCIAGMEQGDEQGESQDQVSQQVTLAPQMTSGFVFQEARLLPWYNVEKNLQLAFPKAVRHSEQTQQQIKQALALVGLSNNLHCQPSQLSGGMAQRVAIARALCRQPNILFMDEPFSALDALTRQKMQQELKRIRKEAECAVVFITHDVEEAVELADRILVMEQGRFAHEYHSEQLKKMSKQDLSKHIIQNSFQQQQTEAPCCHK